MLSNMYLQGLVERELATRGIPGTVRIRPQVPLARRLESGERARFLVAYEGSQAVTVTVDEYEISAGTVGAPIAVALVNKIEKELRRNQPAAAA